VGYANRTNQAARSWELPDGHREHRCQLHGYQLVPEEAARHDYHIAPGEAAQPDGPAHDYQIVAEPDA
jgi:hypothetical protein